MGPTQLRLMPPPVEGPHDRAQRLMAEARLAADDQVADLQRTLFRVAELAADVGQGGDVYPVGVRDLAAKISDDAAWCGQTMQSIMRNVGRATVQPDELPPR